jgi:hypothetical protein
MNLLYDQIVRDGFSTHERASNIAPMIAETFKKAVVIDITNVWNYYKDKITNQKQLWSWKGGDFPNVAPPWPIFFMELHSNAGVLFTAAQIPEQVTPVYDQGEPIDARWAMTAFTVHRVAGQKVTAVTAAYMFMISEDGQRIAWENDNAFRIKLIEWSEDEFNAQPDLAIHLQYGLIFPCLLAISFLHCKNVEIEEHEPRQSRAERRRNEKPGIKFHMIKINPMEKILQHEGKSDQVGLQLALHICRGHFKNYRGRGLFGKHKGLYWWDRYQRGNASRGVIVKNYEIETPLPKP